MNEADVKARAFAMPLTSPAFPPGPYRFVDREYLIVTYRTDPDALRAIIPAYRGEEGSYVHSMFLDDEAPIAGGRELWGVPKKLGSPKLTVETDTLLGVLNYGPVRVAIATARICELVRYNCQDITIKGAWEGPASLELLHHALAPVADLPVLEVLSGAHILTDLTLGLGTVAYDYLG